MLVNLRELYPGYYTKDAFIDVPEEIVAVMREYDRHEAAYQRRTYRHRANYSLDCGDGIEKDVLASPLQPEQAVEKKFLFEQLNSALSSLSAKQAGRIYAYFFLQMSNVEIAKHEGVDEKAIRVSVQSGLKKLNKFLKEREG